jgi:hypothetical protein
MLSLQDPPQAPVRQLSRGEAIALSIVCHLLLLVLMVRGVEGLPGPLQRWLHAAFPPPKPPAEATAIAAALQAEKEKMVQPRPETQKIPVQFAYVKIPEESKTEKNPKASLLSDRDRKARQEVPTPPKEKALSRDPHSKGDSRDRVIPDPRLKEGKDQPQQHQDAAKDENTRVAELGPDQKKGEKNPAEVTRDNRPEGAGAKPETIAPGAGTGAPSPTGSAALRPDQAERGGGQTHLPQQPGGDAEGGGGGHSSLNDMRPSSEFKFRFDNNGWLRGGAYGTLSFDTKGFPWGDYARQIYVIIRNNWLERIPLAAREGGLQGYSCQHFYIAKDGVISELDVVRPSSIPPYNKAASDALRASSALPPLPTDFDKDREGLTFCFYYNMYPGEAD